MLQLPLRSEHRLDGSMAVVWLLQSACSKVYCGPDPFATIQGGKPKSLGETWKYRCKSWSCWASITLSRKKWGHNIRVKNKSIFVILLSSWEIVGKMISWLKWKEGNTLEQELLCPYEKINKLIFCKTNSSPAQLSDVMATEKLCSMRGAGVSKNFSIKIENNKGGKFQARIGKDVRDVQGLL